MIKIQTSGEKLTVTTPYNSDAISEFRSIGGKWDSNRKVWQFGVDSEELVQEILRRVYGYVHFDPDAEMVPVRITATRELHVDQGPVVFPLTGEIIAQAWSRDSGARAGDGVTMMQGKVTSGGSRQYWHTLIEMGSVFRIRIPVAMIDQECDGWEIEKMENRPSARLEELQKVRTGLLERLAEVENEIRDLSS